MAQLNLSDVKLLERRQLKEYWISFSRNASQSGEAMRDVLDFLKTSEASAVSMRLFGSKSSLDTATAFAETFVDECGCPPLLLIPKNPGDEGTFSVQVQAVSGFAKPIYFNNIDIGRMLQDSTAEYYLFNVLPDNPNDTSYAQTLAVFHKAGEILKSLGLDFSHTIRTWLFARDILSWYDQLNMARNEFFQAHGIYDGVVPASTGIGLDNPSESVLTTQFLAVRPLTDKITIEAANSPLQSSALDYQSSFSRGIKVLTPDHHRLSVSGTASIDKAGNTVFIDDIDAQINLTMEVVQAILNDAGMDWKDTSCAMAYFKQREDFEKFDDYCRTHQIELPHVKLHADVCRDDLLFELELDAVKSV